MSRLSLLLLMRFTCLLSALDDLPWVALPSGHTAGWTVEKDAYTVSAPDVMTFLWMENTAMAAFLTKWAEGKGEAVPVEKASSGRLCGITASACRKVYVLCCCSFTRRRLHSIRLARRRSSSR